MENLYTSPENYTDYDDICSPLDSYLSKYGAQTAINRAIIDGIINISE